MTAGSLPSLFHPPFLPYLPPTLLSTLLPSSLPSFPPSYPPFYPPFLLSTSEKFRKSTKNLPKKVSRWSPKPSKNRSQNGPHFLSVFSSLFSMIFGTQIKAKFDKKSMQERFRPRKRTSTMYCQNQYKINIFIKRTEKKSPTQNKKALQKHFKSSFIFYRFSLPFCLPKTDPKPPRNR